MDRVYCEDCKYVAFPDRFLSEPNIWQCTRPEYVVRYTVESSVIRKQTESHKGFCKRCNTGACPLFEKSKLVTIKEFFRG